MKITTSIALQRPFLSEKRKAPKVHVGYQPNAPSRLSSTNIENKMTKYQTIKEK